MKVAHFIEHFFPHLGGGEIHVWDLVQCGLGNIEHVVLTNAVRGYPLESKIGEKCKVLRFPPLDFYPSRSFQFLNIPTYFLRLLSCFLRFRKKICWLKENSFDLLHVHGPGVAINFDPIDRLLGFPLFTRTASFRSLTCPKLFSFHSYMSNFTNHEVDKAHELKFIKEFENIICVDSHITDQVREHCAREKLERDIRFISHTIDTRNFPFKKIEKKEHLRLLFIGRLSREKGVEVLLRLIEKNLPFLKIKLAVADGEYKVDEFRRMMDGKNVEIFGNVSNNEMAAYIHESDLLLNPVLAKGISRVCMEAMACGRSVIMFREGERFPIQDGKTGFLVNPGDYEGLYSLLERMNHHRSLLDRIGEEASKIIFEKFDNRQGFGNIVNFYKDVLH